ncbi:MAG: hypothetical protein JNL72_05525 [Flavipsychrobacter sp.]|nr:hypothetical protein [Flavipsychrobacter sp.]
MKNFTSYLLKATLALPFVVALGSCTQNNGTNPTTASTIYYQDLLVIYDKESKTTNATAMFRTNNATGYIHQLRESETLNINKSLAPFDPTNRTYYWTTNKLVDVDFVFTKNSGYQFLNEINVSDTTSVSFPTVFPNSINRTSGMTVDWDGPALDTNEMLLLVVNDEVHLPVEKPLVNNRWIFTSNDLNNLTPGDNVKIRLEMIRTLPIQASDSNGSGRRRVVVRTTRTISLL